MFKKVKTTESSIPANLKNGKKSFIFKNIIIDGNVKFRDTFIINGTINGDVIAYAGQNNVLEVGGSGKINGNIVCDQLIANGYIKGSIEGKLVVVQPQAQVSGQISYEQIEVKIGAQINGQLMPIASQKADAKKKTIITGLVNQDAKKDANTANPKKNSLENKANTTAVKPPIMSPIKPTIGK